MIFDEDIILPAPSCVSYAQQAILGRNKIQILQTKRENNWFPTAKEIEKIILKNKNKNYLIFLNYPNNPSEQICNNLEKMANINRKYNIIIFWDYFRTASRLFIMLNTNILFQKRRIDLLGF